MDQYMRCELCPHRCRVDRRRGEKGICSQSDVMNIAWIGLHKGEEPPVSGEHGSGTIFFSGCTLHCPYCQNHQISRRDTTLYTPVTPCELSRYMLDLALTGASSINLITGTHFIPSIREALLMAKAEGLTVPVVWNTSGFERPEALELIDDLIDLYLIDIKTRDRDVARRFCGYGGYTDTIEGVMEYLIARHPVTSYDAEDRLSGILVRHLVYPDEIASTRDVLAYFSKTLKAHAHLSLMVQFSDPFDSHRFGAVSDDEYENLIGYLDELGIEEGFVQELEGSIDWIPDFTRDNPFPQGFATPLESFIRARESSSDI